MGGCRVVSPVAAWEPDERRGRRAGSAYRLTVTAVLSVLLEQAVLGLLPVVWIDDELSRGLVGRPAHHQPVQRRDDRVLDQVVVAPVHAAGHAQVYEHEVPHKQAEYACNVDRGREYGVNDVGLRDHPQGCQHWLLEWPRATYQSLP